MMYSALLVTWLLLFNQHLVRKTFGYVVESDEDIDEEIIDTTANTISHDDTIDDDDDDHNSYNNMINKTPTSNSFNKSDAFNVSRHDIVELNVGGQRIVTLRSTLTAVPGSKLALMFAQENKTQKKSKRKNDVAFFDYNPVQFAYLLDQLREIKRMPKFSPDQLDIKPPNNNVGFNFSYMLNELGLNVEHFLFPVAGVYADLNRNSLIGWRKCYTAKYNTPFNISILTENCKSKRLLVACRSVDDKRTLSLAGVGQRENLFTPCSTGTYCNTQKNNRIGFYYAAENAWGFEGRPTSWTGSQNYEQQYSQVLLNPCDTNDQYSEYRLCWSIDSRTGRRGGDRCGVEKNLQNSKRWERLIFESS